MASMNGFAYMTFGQGELIADPVPVRTILQSNLPDPSYGFPGANNIAYVPMRSFDGDTAYNVNEGLDIWKTFRGDFSPPVRSSFNNLTFWGVRNEGIFLEYASSVEIHNSLILGNPSSPINGVYQGVMECAGVRHRQQHGAQTSPVPECADRGIPRRPPGPVFWAQ